MKTLFILLAATFAVSALAQQLANPTPVPANAKVKHAYFVVDPSGVAHRDTGVHAQQLPDAVLLYDSMSRDSGYYFNPGTGSEVQDEIPQPGPACITFMNLWYYATGPAGSKTLQLDLTFYDDSSATDPCPLQEGGCRAGAAVNQTFTFTGLDDDGTYSWIVTITFGTPVTVLESFEVGYKFTYPATTTSAGPILACGNNRGGEFGVSWEWPWGVAYASGSGMDSDNSFIWNAGCYWFGCSGSIYANWTAQFYGDLPFEFTLGGDYGITGPSFDYPRNGCWMDVTDATPSTFTEYVGLWMNPDTGNTIGGLPFNTAGTYQIRFQRQDGYLSALAANQVPNTNIALDCLPVVYNYTLFAGDGTGDNKINLGDLSDVLSNYNQVGQ